ncbi:MAG: JAB domain-containing protein [Oscillospiraceae bacterium]
MSERLLKKFGSFSRVLNASTRELIKVVGIGKSTADFLHMIPQFARYYLDDMNTSTRRVFDNQSAYNQLKSKFIGRRRECVVAMILNSRGAIKFNNVISEGSISQVPIYVRELVQLCIEHDADTVILAHNHTSGNPAPSRGDIVATKEIQLALDGIYVNLEDHMILTDTDYSSMRKSGWLSDVTAATAQFRKNMIVSAREAEEEIQLEK